MKLELSLEDATWLAHFLRDLAEARSSAVRYDASEMARLEDLISRTELARERERTRDPADQGAKILRLVKSQT